MATVCKKTFVQSWGYMVMDLLEKKEMVFKNVVKIYNYKLRVIMADIWYFDLFHFSNIIPNSLQQHQFATLFCQPTTMIHERPTFYEFDENLFLVTTILNYQQVSFKRALIMVIQTNYRFTPHLLLIAHYLFMVVKKRHQITIQGKISKA